MVEALFVPIFRRPMVKAPGYAETRYVGMVELRTGFDVVAGPGADVHVSMVGELVHNLEVGVALVAARL